MHVANKNIMLKSQTYIILLFFLILVQLKNEQTFISFVCTWPQSSIFGIWLWPIVSYYPHPSKQLYAPIFTIYILERWYLIMFTLYMELRRLLLLSHHDKCTYHTCNIEIDTYYCEQHISTTYMQCVNFAFTLFRPLMRICSVCSKNPHVHILHKPGPTLATA